MQFSVASVTDAMDPALEEALANVRCDRL